MQIETLRLEIARLDAEQVTLWLGDMPRLEKTLNCTYRAEPLAGIFREVVAGQLTAVQADPANAQWHTFWLLIRKTDRTVVGSAVFKGVPDPAGEVE